MTFKLDARLELDSIWLADLPLSQLRLMNNQFYTWLIMVPRIANACEIMDLSVEQQSILLAEINLVGKLLKQHFPCDKLNIANLGNVVSQFHVHVIARCKSDAVWPGPVWGGPSEPYDSDILSQKINHLTTLLQQASYA